MMNGMVSRGGGRRGSRDWRWSLVLALSVACATGADEPTSTTVVLGDASADGPMGQTGGETDPGTDTGATGMGGSGQVDGTGEPFDTTGAADGPADEGSSSGEPPPPPPVCMVEPDDVPCEVCGKENCCAEYLACIDDPGCACALDCYLAGGATADCFAMCGATTQALDLFNCAAPACDGICT